MGASLLALAKSIYYLKGLACLSPQGVALATMVGWLSYGNKKFEALDAQMRNLIPPLRQAMLDFIPMVDADTSAFSAFMVEYFIGYDFFLLKGKLNGHVK